jgi:hypothetical protein
VVGLEVMQPITTNYFKGASFGVLAVSIWASWSAITRLAVTTSLDAWDIVALRFGVAGILLSPILLRRRGLALDKPWMARACWDHRRNGCAVRISRGGRAAFRPGL